MRQPQNYMMGKPQNHMMGEPQNQNNYDEYDYNQPIRQQSPNQRQKTDNSNNYNSYTQEEYRN